MINKIWAVFIIIGLFFSIITGNLKEINKEILESAKVTLEMVFRMIPVIALWTGIMNIASDAGILKVIAKKLAFVFKFLFPEIPKNHESIGLIASNIIANMFGLGSAATPFGLKAMKSMQTLNNKKDTASRSMITFLLINTSGIALIPTTVIALRMMHGSINPSAIILPTIIASFLTTIFAVTVDRIYYRVRSKKI